MPTTSESLPLSRIELVVLASLLSRPSDDALGATVEQLCIPGDPAGAKSAALSTLASLRRRRLIGEGSKKLTDEGGRVLRTELGLAKRPSWAQVRDKHLPALGLGLQPGSEAATKAVGSQNALIATVLCEALAIDPVSSPAAVCDALIADQLGMPRGPLTLEAIRAHVLAQRATQMGKANGKVLGKASEMAVRIAAATVGAGALEGRPRQPIALALGRRWASATKSPVSAHGANGKREPVPAEPLYRPAPHGQLPLAIAPPAHSHPAAANAPSASNGSGPPKAIDSLLEVVRDTIPRIGAEGRFGSEKVFVSALWHRMEQARVELSLDHFKRWLLTANRDGHLQLARADLVGAMDPVQVAESEIRDRGATFHFVVDSHRHAATARGGNHVR